MQAVLTCVLHHGFPSLEVAAAIFNTLIDDQTKIFNYFNVTIQGKEGFVEHSVHGSPYRCFRFVEKVFHVKTFDQWQQLSRAYACRLSEPDSNMSLRYNYPCGDCLARDLMIMSMVYDNYDLALSLAILFEIDIFHPEFMMSIFLNGKLACYNHFFSSPLERNQHNITFPRNFKVEQLIFRSPPLNSTELLDSVGVWEWLMTQPVESIAFKIVRFLDIATATGAEMAIRWLYNRFKFSYMDNYHGKERLDIVAPLFMKGFETRIMRVGHPKAVEMIQRCRVLFCRWTSSKDFP